MSAVAAVIISLLAPRLGTADQHVPQPWWRQSRCRGWSPSQWSPPRVCMTSVLVNDFFRKVIEGTPGKSLTMVSTLPWSSPGSRSSE